MRFPRGRTPNLLRGLFGAALRSTAPAAEYERLFTPAGKGGPSGLADRPRPFLLRAQYLDGVAIAESEAFHIDIHVFDPVRPAVERFRTALEAMFAGGVGPGRGTAVLERVDEFRHEVSLEAGAEDAGVRRVRLCFVTPTELKADGRAVERPEFPILFARLRDRISTLRALYGPGPLAVDFGGLGERAAGVRLIDCALRYETGERRSARTGQVHPLGGFTGQAEYEGDVGEFLAWLRAARWVGVGRHTVWGQGDVRVIP